MSYPKVKYHPIDAPNGRVVRSVAEEEALGANWFDSPATFAESQLGANLRKVGDTSVPVTRSPSTPHLTYYVEWGPNAAGGQLVVESAHSPTYRGTWAPITTVDFSGPGRVDEISVVGLHLATRVRVAEEVLGDSANVFGMTA